LLSFSRVAICSVLNVLVLTGCGGGIAYYQGAEPNTVVAVIEGYDRIVEKAEITGVGRPGDAGIERSILSRATRVQVAPGERCVQVEVKRSAGEASSCAFVDYFVAGQHYQLKAGSLKLDKPDAATEGAVSGTMQIEVSATGYKTHTRRIQVRCGIAMRKVCETENPPLPRQGL
jgi:hypothetical protein